jgi:hypothetical protein
MRQVKNTGSLLYALAGLPVQAPEVTVHGVSRAPVPTAVKNFRQDKKDLHEQARAVNHVTKLSAQRVRHSSARQTRWPFFNAT